jgi:hypothetical protein
MTQSGHPCDTDPRQRCLVELHRHGPALLDSHHLHERHDHVGGDRPDFKFKLRLKWRTSIMAAGMIAPSESPFSLPPIIAAAAATTLALLRGATSAA